LCPSIIGHPDAQFAEVGTDDHVSTIRASTLDNVAKLGKINWARASETRRRRRERHYRGQYVRAPEDSRLICGKLRIDRKR